MGNVVSTGGAGRRDGEVTCHLPSAPSDPLRTDSSSHTGPGMAAVTRETTTQVLTATYQNVALSQLNWIK